MPVYGQAGNLSRAISGRADERLYSMFHVETAYNVVACHVKKTYGKRKQYLTFGPGLSII